VNSLPQRVERTGVLLSFPFHSSSIAVLSLFRHQAAPLRCAPTKIGILALNIGEQMSHRTLMHECNGIAKSVRLRRKREHFACFLDLRRS
jgi:hypothetical protein